jgi:hypothetical protein
LPSNKHTLFGNNCPSVPDLRPKPSHGHLQTSRLKNGVGGLVLSPCLSPLNTTWFPDMW